MSNGNKGKSGKGAGIVLIAMIAVAVVLTVNNHGGRLFENKDEKSSTGMELFTSSNLVNKDYDLSEIDELVIDYVSTEIIVQPGAKYNLQYTLYDYQEPDIDLKNRTLKLIEPSHNSTFNFNREHTQIIVTIPEGKYLEAFIDTTSGPISVEGNISGKLESVSGKIRLLGGSGDQVKCNTTSGEVVLDGCDADELIVNTVSGAISINDSHGSSLDIDTTSGAVNVYNAKYNKIKHYSTSGSLNIGATATLNLDTESTSGSADIELEGDASDYGFDLQAVSGSIYVGSNKFDKEYKTGNWDGNLIESDRISGSFKIKFK